MSEEVKFGKRPPPTEINRQNLEKGIHEEKEINAEFEGKQCTDEEIAARKILKIRRGGKFLSEETCMEATNNSEMNQNNAKFQMSAP